MVASTSMKPGVVQPITRLIRKSPLPTWVVSPLGVRSVFPDVFLSCFLFPFPLLYFFVCFECIRLQKGTGRVSGRVVTDVVFVAGLSVAGQALISVNNKSDEFNRQLNDGLIGMAFGTIAQCRQSTFFENLIKERKLAAPLFSVHLSRHEELFRTFLFIASSRSVEMSVFERLVPIGVLRLYRPQMDHGFRTVVPRRIESRRSRFTS